MLPAIFRVKWHTVKTKLDKSM